MSSTAETLLAVQLEQAGIPFEREYRFSPPRRWRADFMLPSAYLVRRGDTYTMDAGLLLIEIEGGAYSGGHKRFGAYESDCEKANAAALQGWTVLRFTPQMVDDGRALAVIRAALGMEVAA